MVSVLKEDGSVAAGGPELADDQLLDISRTMVQVREFDRRMLMLQRVADEGVAPGDVELSTDMFTVMVHGAWTEAQLVGDFLRGAAFRHQFIHASLHRRKPLPGIRLGSPQVDERIRPVVQA